MITEGRIRMKDDILPSVELTDEQMLKIFIESEDWERLYEWANNNHYTKDPETARLVMMCYEICMEHGNTDAALNLGTFYYNGLFVPQDYEIAYELYKISADAGEVRAINNVGYCWYYGRHAEADYEKAYYYFSQGATVFEDANCLYKLGDMYLNGYYVEKNEAFAVRLYNHALKVCEEGGSGDYCIGDVFLRLGKCLLKGIGFRKDPNAAHHFLSLGINELYKRCEYDTNAGAIIREHKKYLREAERIMEKKMAKAMEG